MKYRQKTIVTFIIFLWTCFAGAQIIITGVVCDKATKLPVSDVYVNLGRTIYAITDVSGRFEVRTTTASNAPMTLHHVSYQTVNIDNPFNGLPDTLYIEEQMNRISEITVTASKKRKIIKRSALVEYVIGNDDSVRSVKLIRSSGYPSIDDFALQIPYFALKIDPVRPREKPIRERHGAIFDKHGPPPPFGRVIDFMPNNGVEE